MALYAMGLAWFVLGIAAMFLGKSEQDFVVGIVCFATSSVIFAIVVIKANLE